MSLKMNKRLNIAVLGTASLPIPPFEGYGGTQRGIYDFLVHMNEKGHKLHLFGPGDSQVSDLENVVLHSFVKNSLWVPGNTLSRTEKRRLSQQHHQKSREALHSLDFEEPLDIINIRSDGATPIIVGEFGPEKIVYSLHNVTNQSRIDLIRDLKIQCVAHCRNHKEQHENLPNVQIIMYGINVDRYPFSQETLSQTAETPTLNILQKLQETKQDYLITLGGIGEHKGQATSIDLAKNSGIPLIIAGEPQDRTNNKKGKYFEAHIKPHIDGENVIYFGNANEEEKKELIKFSKGFLFPSGYEDRRWNEPFGRAPIEALACGTPVIAYRSGSMPEVIFDGFNGYLFETFEEGFNAVQSLDSLNRENCRRTAEEKFHSKRVADEYEKLFYEIITKKD